MTIEITIAISIISVSAALYFGIKSSKRADKKDVAEESAHATSILIKLETIGSGISEIKSDIRAMKTDVKDITERLIVVEQSTKSAHNRLDEHIRTNKI